MGKRQGQRGGRVIAQLVLKGLRSVRADIGYLDFLQLIGEKPLIVFGKFLAQTKVAAGFLLVKKVARVPGPIKLPVVEIKTEGVRMPKNPWLGETKLRVLANTSQFQSYPEILARSGERFHVLPVKVLLPDLHEADHRVDGAVTAAEAELAGLGFLDAYDQVPRIRQRTRLRVKPHILEKSQVVKT